MGSPGAFRTGLITCRHSSFISSLEYSVGKYVGSYFSRISFAASKLDKQTLANLVNQARQQGISEDEIEAGLNFLLKLR